MTAIVVGTFVGGPMATGLMVGSNFFRMGEKKKAWQAILAGFIGSLALLLILFTIPDNYREEIVFVTIPVIYTTVVYILLELFHHTDLVKHKNKGGLYRRLRQAASYGLSGLVFSMLIIFLHFNAQGINYNTMKFGNNRFSVLYEKELPKDEARKLGDFLFLNGYFSEDQSKAIFIVKPDSYEVKLVLDNDLWYDQEHQMDLRILESLLNQGKFKREISLIITDKDLSKEVEIN